VQALCSLTGQLQLARLAVPERPQGKCLQHCHDHTTLGSSIQAQSHPSIGITEKEGAAASPRPQSAGAAPVEHLPMVAIAYNAPVCMRICTVLSCNSHVLNECELRSGEPAATATSIAAGRKVSV
jgi:hypothetical protein